MMKERRSIGKIFQKESKIMISRNLGRVTKNLLRDKQKEGGL